MKTVGRERELCERRMWEKKKERSEDGGRLKSMFRMKTETGQSDIS